MGVGHPPPPPRHPGPEIGNTGFEPVGCKDNHAAAKAEPLSCSQVGVGTNQVGDLKRAAHPTSFFVSSSSLQLVVVMQMRNPATSPPFSRMGLRLLTTVRSFPLNSCIKSLNPAEPNLLTFWMKSRYRLRYKKPNLGKQSKSVTSLAQSPKQKKKRNHCHTSLFFHCSYLLLSGRKHPHNQTLPPDTATRSPHIGKD